MANERYTTAAFTGTRQGMTAGQYERVFFLMRRATRYRRITLSLASVSHGCCDGSDREFGRISQVYQQSLWPSNAEQLQWAQDFKAEIVHAQIHDILPPLIRNRHIVDENDFLVATPSTMGEAIRSGTWMTIRYARSLKRPILLIWPNGEIHPENWP